MIGFVIHINVFITHIFCNCLWIKTYLITVFFWGHFYMLLKSFIIAVEDICVLSLQYWYFFQKITWTFVTCWQYLLSWRYLLLIDKFEIIGFFSSLLYISWVHILKRRDMESSCLVKIRYLFLIGKFEIITFFSFLLYVFSIHILKHNGIEGGRLVKVSLIFYHHFILLILIF